MTIIIIRQKEEITVEIKASPAIAFASKEDIIGTKITVDEVQIKYLDTDHEPAEIDLATLLTHCRYCRRI